MKKSVNKWIFFIIFFLGIALRLNNVNWDQNFHLHPDERFLTMVGNALRFPGNLIEYFDPDKSRLNPYNVGFKFYVYGVFPIILNKIVALIFDTDNYNDFTLQGRILSALFDAGVIILVYKIVEIFERKYKFNKKIKIYAAFFYAMTVFSIQASHFFTTDTFLNFFAIFSLYFVLKFIFEKKFLFLTLSSALFAMAVASKISALYIVVLNIASFFLLIRKNKKSFFYVSFYIISYVILSYLFLRVFNPYYFDSANFLNPGISSNFLSSLKSLRNVSNINTSFPPAIQWISKSPVFPLINISVFGVGIFYFFLSLWGILEFLKRKKFRFGKILVIWSCGLFIFQSFQFVKTMRYFIFLYPFLAIFASMGFYRLNRLLASTQHKNLSRVIRKMVVILVIIWPLMFSSIYFSKHVRVLASEWIYENLESNSTILGEHWDDSLPLPMNYQVGFKIKQLPVFDPDTSEKWRRMQKLLGEADYYVLSSNRGWGSITALPERYPKMSTFYRALLSQDCVKQKEFIGVCYKKIKEFVSYPSLCLSFLIGEKDRWGCITFPDYWAEEAFTVYDHPQVMIFKKVNERIQD